MANKDERCGKSTRHNPHWWPSDSPSKQLLDKWCDGKLTNPALVKD